nr:MAG: hypothetical protein EDM05_21875 [Leptolyngbya sp. IPPAS B-1204]
MTPIRFTAHNQEHLMIQSTIKLNGQDSHQTDIQTRIWSAVCEFWRFSNFYGDYLSLPPSARYNWSNSKK